MSDKPLIGITAYSRTNPDNGWLYDVSYAGNAAAIQAAGGLPVLIPASLDLETLRAIYHRLDGVLLPGGGDISPHHYAAQVRTKLMDVSEERDRAELALARWAQEDNLPTLGICRGIQLINVALGGTLTQDIPSELDTSLVHNLSHQQPRATRMHSVDLNPDSRLAEALGDTHAMVNSLHHQAIDQLAPQAVVSAWAPDGLVEGIEVPEMDFFMAVQWHPEDMLDDARHARLFESFVAAARQRMQARVR